MGALAVFSFLCLFAAYSCQSHDLVLGQISYRDVLLYKLNEYKCGFPLIVRTSIIEYPEPGMHNFAYTIRAINIKDNVLDGTGGYPSIIGGGIGQQFVRITLESQRGSGFNFTVIIYGRN